MPTTQPKITDAQPTDIALPGAWMLRTNDLDSLADWFKIHCPLPAPTCDGTCS